MPCGAQPKSHTCKKKPVTASGSWLAGGIRASNVRTVALMTGVREVHTSLSKDVEAKPSDGGAELGALLNSHKSYRVLEHDVRAFKSALDAIAVESKQGARLQ